MANVRDWAPEPCEIINNRLWDPAWQLSSEITSLNLLELINPGWKAELGSLAYHALFQSHFQQAVRSWGHLFPCWILWRQSKVFLNGCSRNVTWKAIKCPRRKSPSCFRLNCSGLSPSSCFLIVKRIPLILRCVLALSKGSRHHISFQTSRQTCRDPLRRWPIERELPMEKSYRVQAGAAAGDLRDWKSKGCH